MGKHQGSGTFLPRVSRVRMGCWRMGFWLFQVWGSQDFSIKHVSFRKGTEGGLLKEGGRKKKMMMKMIQPGMDDSTDC